MSGASKAVRLLQNSDESLRLLTLDNGNVHFFDIRASDGSAAFVACDESGAMDRLIFVPRQAVRHLCEQFPYLIAGHKEQLREPLEDAKWALDLVF